MKEDPKSDKTLSFSDHGLVMKKLFVHKYIKKLGSNKRLSDQQEEEDFMTYLGHY